ncbi:MAG: peptidylprolyl isomerase [Pseudomonadota bacterium]
MSSLRVETTMGAFDIALQEAAAPATCDYFKQLVAADRLRGAEAFRMLCERNQPPDVTSPIHVIQFGRDEWMTTRQHEVPLEHTRRTGLSHQRWSVSAARFGATELYGSFFVCMREEPALDYGGDRHADGQGFAVFGEVCRGFATLEQIFAAPVTGEQLDPPIAVTRFSLVAASQ